MTVFCVAIQHQMLILLSHWLIGEVSCTASDETCEKAAETTEYPRNVAHELWEEVLCIVLRDAIGVGCLKLSNVFMSFKYSVDIFINQLKSKNLKLLKFEY